MLACVCKVSKDTRMGCAGVHPTVTSTSLKFEMVSEPDRSEHNGADWLGSAGRGCSSVLERVLERPEVCWCVLWSVLERSGAF